MRITTSLKKQDGARAVGTKLDRAGPAYAPLVAGRSYTGLAKLFGRPYITQYKPVTDATGRVIGALFVGLDIGAELKLVEDGIRSLKIGDNGYYFVLDASQPSRGTFVVHPDADGQRADDTRAPYAQMLATGQGRLAYVDRPGRTMAARPPNSCRSRRFRSGSGSSAASRSTTNCSPPCAPPATAS